MLCKQITDTSGGVAINKLICMLVYIFECGNEKSWLVVINKTNCVMKIFLSIYDRSL